MIFGKMPIRRRLTAVILLTSVVVIVMMCAAFFTYEYVSFRRLTVRRIETLAEITATNSTAALAFDNPGDAREILSSLRTVRTLQALQLP